MNPLLIAETTALCFNSLARCCKQGNDARAVFLMKDEIRQIARGIAQYRLSGEAKARLFLKPMETALVKHYGAHVGRRLYWSFVDAFWLQSWSVTSLPLNETEPNDPPILELASVERGDDQDGISLNPRHSLSLEKDDPAKGRNFLSARCG
jgi:hypothetical protein